MGDKKDVGPYCSTHSLNLILNSPCMQFWFDYIISKYFNFISFLKD